MGEDMNPREESRLKTDVKIEGEVDEGGRDSKRPHRERLVCLPKSN